jgi:hypothetical protein
MTSYTQVFGGSTIQSADVSYRAVTLAANTQLYWPSSWVDSGDIVAKIMDVTPSAGSLYFTMDDATLISTGEVGLFRNLGAVPFSVKSYTGTTVATIASGGAVYLYLTDNSTQGGTWQQFQFGIGSTTIDASALAGSGIVALANTLNQSHPVATKAANYTLVAGDRAQTIVWTGGSGTFAVTAAATLGDNWFAVVKNGGSGTLTIDPNASETVDGATTASLSVNDACFLICSGTAFWTIGLGRNVTISYTKLTKSVAGSADVTLTAAEAANLLQEYTGILTGNINVIVPTSVGIYHVFNNTTGAYSLTVKTVAGTGVAVTQATRTLLDCDGVNVVLPLSAGTGTVTSVASGTGLTGGPVTTTGTISIATTGVVAGSYNAPVVAVNAQGQITSATAGEVFLRDFAVWGQ